jgi:hypothetical protein
LLELMFGGHVFHHEEKHAQIAEILHVFRNTAQVTVDEFPQMELDTYEGFCPLSFDNVVKTCTLDASKLTPLTLDDCVGQPKKQFTNSQFGSYHCECYKALIRDACTLNPLVRPSAAALLSKYGDVLNDICT